MKTKMKIEMKAKVRSLVMGLIGTAFFSNVYADISIPMKASEIQLNPIDFSYGGNGCPKNSAYVSSLNQKMVAFFHPNFKETLSSGEQLNRKSCMVRIPIKGEKGFQVALQAVSVGQMDLGRDDTLSLGRELFVAGRKGEMQSQSYSGELSQRLIIGEQVKTNLAYSACGEDAILAMNLTANLRDEGQSIKSSSYSLTRTYLSLIIRKCE